MTMKTYTANRLEVACISPGYYFQEASTLGLPPGMWPERLETDICNGKAFELKARHADRCVYVQPFSRHVLNVVND